MIRAGMVLDLCWAVLGLYWLFSALGTKKISVDESAGLRLFRLVILGLTLALLMTDWLRIGPLAWRFVPDHATLIWLGVALTGAGVGLAVWARAPGSQLERQGGAESGSRADSQRAVCLFAASDLYRRFAGGGGNGADRRRMARSGGAGFAGNELLREGDSRRENSDGRVWRGLCRAQTENGVLSPGVVRFFVVGKLRRTKPNLSFATGRRVG